MKIQTDKPNRSLKSIVRVTFFSSLLCVFAHVAVIAQQSNVNISFVSNLTTCGSSQTATVTFTALDTLNNISGSFDFTELPGIVFDEGSFSSLDGVSFMTPNQFSIPDLVTGEVAVFTMGFRAICGSGDLGGSNFLEFDVDYVIDSFIPESNVGMSGSPGFAVLLPGLDFIMASTDMFRPVVNETDTIVKSIANAGDGNLDSAFYFVIDHPNLTLCEVYVEGLDNAFMPTGMTYSLDPAGTSGDTLFFWIGEDAITRTGNFDAIWDGLSGGQESFMVYEIWKGSDCADDPDDIIRGVGYGCDLLDPILLCESQDNNSTVVFDRVPEIVSGPYDWGEQRPACYADDETQVGYFVTNIGEAPADTVVVNVTTSSTGNIVSYQYSLTGRSGLYLDGLPGSTTGMGCAGVISVRDTIFDANLDVGDTLYIRAEMLYDCSCHPSCQISGVYQSNITTEALDRCGDGITGGGAGWGNYGVNLSGFVEGPFEITSGETGCITYTLTGYRNNWFNGAYPNSYYEMQFNFPAGLEIDNATIVWEDNDGTTFSPTEVNFVDGSSTMGDTITVQWEQDMIPMNWSPGAGNQIMICFDADCAVPCGGEFDVTMTAQMDFVIDPTCSTCTQEDVFCPTGLPMILQCYSPGMCSCDGLAVRSLDINRVNLGLGDTDNDNCPEMGETIDPDLVETKRFLTGDTLKAQVEAIVVGSPTGVNPWINSQFAMASEVANIDPIGGTFRIVDVSANMTYTCDVLSIMTNAGGGGDSLLVDLSVATLNSFCPSIPMAYEYQDGDSLELCLFFMPEENYTGQQTPRIFETNWTIDDGINPAQSCNQESERITQVGISQSYVVDINNNFGGCNLTNIDVEERRYFGGQSFDEFPFEVRHLGIPEEFVYVKPAEFSFVPENFGFRLQGQLQGNVVNSTNGNSAFLPYILISGDTLTFKAGDYLRSLGSPKIPTDEGYYAFFRPRIQGDCRSIPGFYPNSTYLSSTVEEIHFGTPLITRPWTTQNIQYTGGPQLLVIPEANNLVVDQPNQCIAFTLDNTSNINAPNSFLYITSPSGNVVINELIETTGGGSATIMPTPLGIYPLGLTSGSEDRTFEICVTVNSCQPESLDFIAGWDCSTYPTSIAEAICQDPSTVEFTLGTAGLGLLVNLPTKDTIIDLCDTLEYEVVMNSTMSGSLRDLELSFDLPVGHQFVSGSFRYMWPQLPPSGFITGPDPDNPYGNYFETVITDLDPTLMSDGLPGNGFIPNNAVVIRFKTVTTCDIISGQAASFYANAMNACGDPVNRRFFPGKRIFISGAIAEYNINLETAEFVLNPCTEDMATVDIGVLVTTNPGVTTMPGDTIRVILPPGVLYDTDSYMAGGNAAMVVNPIITNMGGQQMLDWPIVNGLSNGSLIDFTFDVTAEDLEQQCQDYDMRVQTFSTTGSSCVTSGPCDIGVQTGSINVPISLVKPSLSLSNFSGMLIQLPPTEEVLMYTVDVENTSTIGIPNGTILPLKIYEDVDNSGTPTMADILLSVDTTVIDSLGPGRTLEIMVSDTFPAGEACRLIAVIDPDTACVCALDFSNQMQPVIKFDFPRDVFVCSSVDTVVGPVPIPGYDYTWLSVEGSFLGALDDPDTTQTTFQYQNLSGAPITYRYALRAISDQCVVYDTLSVTVNPETADTVSMDACLGEDVLLPGPINGSDFMWTPAMDLDDPMIMFPTLINPTMNQEYTVTYTDENGCPASLVVQVSVVNCAAGTALGDTLWFDENGNGIFEPGELPVPGATVLLYPANNPNGPHIRVDTTDANGMYFFDNLNLGEYIVRFIPPDGFAFTMQDIGNDTLDSDANPTTGLTGPYFLNNGDINTTVDAGLISDCDLSLDLSVGPCVAMGDSIVRMGIIDVEWSDAVYTYDFLNGEDSIVVQYLGRMDTIVTNLLTGSAQINFVWGPSSPAMFDVTAQFLVDTACKDTVVSEVLDPCIFDLALIKEVDSSGTNDFLIDNDTVKFKITVYNQGNITAENIVVKDHLGCGYSLIPNIGDLIAADTSVFIRGPIPPGGFDTACIYVRLQQPIDVASSCTGSGVYDNFAEIVAYEDENGNQLPDVDSEPNSNSPQENSTLPGSPGDNDTTSTDINGVGSEDDHDPANVSVFDLALRKTFDPSVGLPPFFIGDTVKYLISVHGQGNVAADRISIADTLFAGLEFIPMLNPGWTDIGGNVVQFDSLLTADPIEFGDSISFCLYVRVRQSAEPNAFLNMAKISSARDVLGMEQSGDNDSPFDQNFTNNPGGNPGTPTDDYIGGVGTGTPLGTNPRGDLDSHDPAVLTVPTRVGDTTFVDINYDGLQTEGVDLPLEGVTVTLFQIDPFTMMGVPVTMDIFGQPYSNTRVTDVTGQYLFDSLPEGQYYVVFDISTVPMGERLVPTIENVNGGMLDSDDSDIGVDGISDTTTYLTSSVWELSLDAGWVLPVVIGDTVFLDDNVNGIQDPTDPPLANVTVSLYDAMTGALVTQDAYGNTITGMTMTDMNGFYLFDSLYPGEYYVEFDPGSIPGGPLLAPTLENVNGISLDPDDSDVNFMGLSDTAFVTMSNDTNLTLDAGFYYPVVLGDTVFVDENLNGLQDPGDSPLAGVTVTLRDAVTGNVITMDAFGNTISGTQITDANGFYLFDSLPPGEYYVSFDVTTVPGGPVLVPTTENVNGGSLDPNDSDVNSMGLSDTVTLMHGDTNRTLDAGYFLPAVVGDTVFVDINYDGLQDGGDLPLEGVTVTLRDALTGNIVTTNAFGESFSGMTVTDASGFYLFDSLYPGEYYVEFDVGTVAGSPFLVPTTENVNGGSLDPDDSDVNFLGLSDTADVSMSGDSNLTLDAGYFYPKVVGDTVFVDENFDGLQDSGDSPLEGVTVTLYDATTGTVVMADAFGNMITGTQVTNADGYYLFDSLPPGEYYVTFDVTTVSGAPVLAPTLENVNGGSLDPGDSDVNALGLSDTAILMNQDTNRTLDAGYFLPVVVGDTVFVDINYNGLQDSGDPPLEGVTVTLRDAVTGMIVTTNAFGETFSGMSATDASGFYLFDSLYPGEYYVEFDVSTVVGGPLLAPTRENVNGASLDPNDSDVNFMWLSDTADVTMSNDTNLTLDAGFYFPVVLGDTVFIDENFDGLQDAGDSPLAGVTVTLYDALTGAVVTTDAFGNTISGTQITDANGFYLFDSLPPGEYYVAFDVTSVPGGPVLAPTTENVNGGSLDPIDSDVNSIGLSDTVTLMHGDTNRTLDAGYFLPSVVGDTVFVDINYDGLQDGGDLPLEGVTVTLRDALTGNIVTTNAFGETFSGMTMTDAAGFYLFDSLYPGEYYVEFDVGTVAGSPFLVPTTENVNGGSLDPDDSDVNFMGLSDTADVSMSGDSNLTLDAGYFYPKVVGDTVFVDENFDGLQDPGDNPLEGVTVTLYDATTGTIVMADAFGNMITGTQVTNANGYYLFDSLPPGEYYVTFDVTTVSGAPVLAPTLENLNGGSLDPEDSDVNSMGLSDTVVLMDQDTNRTLDAGYFFPVVVGDTVFVDINYDGLQDAGDLPLEGVTITLRDAVTGMIVTTNAFGETFSGMTVTDASGFYLFDSLYPGEYYVEFDVGTVAGAPLLAPTLENVNGGSLDPDDSDVNLMGLSDTTDVTMSGDSNLTLDAGYFYPKVIGDTVFIDENFDGLQDPGDSPLANVTVTLYDAITGTVVTTDAFGNMISGTQVTDANGFYLFDSLPPGDYYVTFDVTTIPGAPVLAPTLENINGVSLDPDDSDVNSMGLSDTVTLMDQDTNRTLDAGYFYPVVVGDTVFVDVNYNGLQDGGDLPLEGVTVTLRDAMTGMIVTTNGFGEPFSGMTVTDASGFYLFDSLYPGEYYVEFDVTTVPGMPVLASTLENVNGIMLDPNDSDVDLFGRSDTVSLVMSGDSNLTLDAGYYFPVVVGDTVFLDVNYNGLQDITDLPLGGVTVTLRDAVSGDTVTTDAFGNTITGSTLTDANGFYLFDSLPPGIYFVEFDISTAGFSLLAPTLENVNGISLDEMDSDVNLLGYSDTATLVMSRDTNLSLDAGYFSPGVIGDYAFVDNNADGRQDAGDSPLPGVTVTLYDATTGMPVPFDAFGNPLMPEVTDMNGMYLFDSLPYGTFYVVFDNGTIPLNLGPTFENVGDTIGDSDINNLGISDTVSITYLNDTILTLDAGYFELHSIGNQVWSDANNDGLITPGELLIEGVEVVLHKVDAMGGLVSIDTATTNAMGLYLFDRLIVGDYIVEITPDNFLTGGVLEGYASSSGGGANYDGVITYENPTAPVDPDLPIGMGVDGDDNGVRTLDPLFSGAVISDTLSLGSDEPQFEMPDNDLSNALDSLSNLTVDFGFTLLHSIGNQVWLDTDNNGILDVGEDPIANVDVILHHVGPSGSIIVDTLTTDANGLYLFDSLIAGDYFVEIPAYNFKMGSVVDGYASSSGTSAGVGPYEPGPDPDDPMGAGIDLDDNGTFNGNPTLPGSVVSDTLTLLADEPLSETPDNDMSGAFDSLSNLTVDFGLYAPVSVGDTVWIDINEDGVFDPSESPLVGVTATLYVWNSMTMMPELATTDAYGNPIMPMMTDADGHYLFDNLPPGNYLVQFDVSTAVTGDGNAPNWQVTYQNQGVSDSLDSDADEFTGFSDTTGFLPSGTHDPTLDAGFFPPRYDLALTKGLAPGQDMLVNPDDTVTMWIIVANQGNVPSGKYTVNDVLPSGMEFVDAIPMEVFAMDSVVQWCDSLPDIVGINNFATDTFIVRAWINPTGQGLRDFQFRNWAEISTDSDDQYMVTEEDSDPDDNTGYDDDDGPGTPPNDPFTDADLDDVLLDSLPGDEDDSDYVDLFTRRFDLAINKQLSPNEPDNVVLPGDTVSFDLKIYNQGNDEGGVGIPADNITIVDYVPVNLILVEENGWSLVNDSLAARTLEVGDELMPGGLVPDSCVVVDIRFTMTDQIIVPTINVAEIANATDTAGIEIIDFDSDLDSINQDINVDDSLSDNSFEMIDVDGDGIVDEDDSDLAEIISCIDVNCLASINVGLGPDCILEVTPAMLLVDPRVAIPRPDFYEVTLEYFDGPVIPDNILTSSAIGKRIKATIEFVGPAGCPQGTCWTEITVNGSKQVYFGETLSKTVYCTDPLLQLEAGDPLYPKPAAFETCSDRALEVLHAGDWIDTYDCVLGEQDTAKVIYREWYAISGDGIRASTFDTIVVMRLPEISEDNLYCQMRDTTYCGVGNFGPYLILPDVCPDDGESACDTLFLMDYADVSFSSSCGLSVHVDSTVFTNDGCTRVTKYALQIKQDCYGMLTDPLCLVDDSEVVITGGDGSPVYATCEFWVVDLDTLAPMITGKYDEFNTEHVIWPGDVIAGATVHCYDTDGKPIIIVPAESHDCAGLFRVPSVCVADDWSGILQAKATIEGIGSWLLFDTGESCLTSTDTGYCYRSDDVISLPMTDEPVEIQYEVLDSCHNRATFSYWILVKDQLKPVVTTNKGLIVSLSDKQGTVDAISVDEGSWDNCAISTLLIRRKDWYNAYFDLCDSVRACYVSTHGDTIWEPVVSSKSAYDSLSVYYAKQLQWLIEDGGTCTSLVWNAWQYDLMRYATQGCRDELLDDETFDHLFKEAYINDEFFRDKFHKEVPESTSCLGKTEYSEIEVDALVDEWRLIGGGWLPEVAFTCDDVCGTLPVEILALDYWCNWNVGWSDIYVEDKTPVEVLRHVDESVEISCVTYKEDGIDQVVARAMENDPEAFVVLDSLFGGYSKAWVDPYGGYVDADGNVIHSHITFIDHAQCTCVTETVQVQVYDDHLGTYWKDSVISNCYYLADTLQWSEGVIAANCGANIECRQEVWTDFDGCGQGYILRKWHISKACEPGETDHGATDTLTLHQRIWVGNACTLSRYMFDLPSDTTLQACDITYLDDGSGLIGGIADPEITGMPEYTFDDDCRLVGVGRSDKVFKIVGGDEGCYKIYRTWYFADWCDGKPVDDTWWKEGYALDSFIQKIILIDTLAPSIQISGPVDNGGTIEASGCSYNFEFDLRAEDECGTLEYAFELMQTLEDSSISIEHGLGSLEAIASATIEDLQVGSYRLRVRVTDLCQNESYAFYDFEIENTKKPSAVCVTSLTVTLNDMDLDGDGEIDTSMAVVWAEEFNASSIAPCGIPDSLLDFRIELIDGVGDDLWQDDTSYLEVTCPMGTQPVRFWVIDPDGNADFCDVLLVVQGGTTCEISRVAQALDVNDLVERQSADDPGSEVEIVTLKDQWKVTEGIFELYQNTPNPFKVVTSIGFYLPEKTKATLSIYDSTGKLLYTFTGMYTKGLHEVSVRRDQLNRSGVLYYQLDSPKYTSTRKMIITE